ncbi:DUF443 family protein [Streptococcus pluranimalium]
MQFLVIDKMIPTQKGSLFYRTLILNEEFYIISTFQFFLGTVFFFYNWIKPVKIVPITKNEYDNLRLSNKKKNSVSIAIILLSGVLLGNAIYSQFSEVFLNFFYIRLFTLLVVFVAFYLIWYYLKYKVKKSILYHKKLETDGLIITIRPTKKYLLIFLQFIIVLCFQIYLFLSVSSFLSTGKLTTLFIVAILLNFSILLNVSSAFYPNQYQMSK